jgi:C-terminal processing protease CtpA/Prc
VKHRAVLIFISIILVTNLSYSQDYQKLLHPYNLDFEMGTAGSLPIGWTLPIYAYKNGFQAVLSTENPKTGVKCLELRHFADSLDELGSVMQSIDAKPYRGRTIRFRAAIRAEINGPRGSAHLWLRVHLTNDCTGLEDFREQQPVVINDWQYYEITGKIDNNADVINYGLMLIGNGNAWIDDASFEFINLDTLDNKPPSPLTERALNNLEAFAKLTGYVRYYYPGELAVATDWDKFTLNGIDYVEKAASEANLVELLNNLFRPIAPDIEIYPEQKKKRFSKVIEPPKNAIPRITLVKRHTGPDIESNATVIKSDVVNVYSPLRDKEGAVFQIINAQPYQGKTVIFSAYVKADVILPAGQAQLAIRVDKGENDVLSMKTMFDNPITKNEWKKYSIETFVPDSATTIRIGLVLFGEGKAWFDDTKLSVIENGQKLQDYNPRNAGFEESDTGKITNGWFFLVPSENAGYSAIVTGDDKKEGEKSLVIYSDEMTSIKLPEIGEMYSGSLTKNISFTMPLTCFLDSTGSLPHPPRKPKILPASKPDDFFINPDDRTSRLSIVTTLWNIYKQFSVYDVPENYDEALRKTLKKAAVDKNKEDFLKTLQEICVESQDGQARGWLGIEENLYGLPFLWRYIEGELVVYKTFGEKNNLNPGDIVLEINGKTVSQQIADRNKYHSGNNPKWEIMGILAELRAGKKDSKVQLKIKSISGKVYEQTFTRDMMMSETNEALLSPIAELKNNIYYVDLTRITEYMLKNNLDVLQKGKGIIFDIRGFSQLPNSILSYFTDQSINSIQWRLPIFTAPDHKIVSYKIFSKMISPKGLQFKNNVVFICDERTYGNSESLLFLIKYYKLGKIIGSPTAGMAPEVLGFTVPGDYHFVMTGLIGVLPDGTEINKKEIQPDIEATQSLKSLISDKDDILEKAVEYIEGH